MAQLGAFVFTRTLDTLVEPSADKLTALIEINRTSRTACAATPDAGRAKTSPPPSGRGCTG